MQDDGPGTPNACSFARRWFRELATVPNGLTLVRLVLGLVFPWLAPAWRGPVILLAACSDLADGALSRYCGLGSKIGRVLDPVADKVFLVGVVASLLWEGELSWSEVLILAVRDSVVLFGTGVGLATRNWAAFRTMTPTLLGKATTAALFALFLGIVLLPEHRSWTFLLASCLSVAAGAEYLVQFFKHHTSRPPKMHVPC